jgi:hypothetical protein
MIKPSMMFSNDEVQSHLNSMLKRIGGGFTADDWFDIKGDIFNHHIGIGAIDHKNYIRLAVVTSSDQRGQEFRIHTIIKYYDENEIHSDNFSTSHLFGDIRIGETLFARSDTIPMSQMTIKELKAGGLNRFLIIAMNDLKGL